MKKDICRKFQNVEFFFVINKELSKASLQIEKLLHTRSFADINVIFTLFHSSNNILLRKIVFRNSLFIYENILTVF
jgi:hypothetical protein